SQFSSRMAVRGVALHPARPALHCPPPTRPRTHRRCATHVRQQLHDVAVSALPSSASQVPVHTPQAEVELSPGKLEGYWSWKGYKIRYQRSGSTGLPILLVHGFGGNAGRDGMHSSGMECAGMCCCPDHFRKNTVVLGAQHRTYAIDLLGYGFSSKPDPRNSPPNSIYNFSTWGQQLCDFLEQASSAGRPRGHGGMLALSPLGELHLNLLAASLSSLLRLMSAWLALQVVGEPAVLVCNSVGGLAGLEASILRPDLVKAVQLLDISLRGLHVKRQPPWQRPLVAAFQQLLRETELGVQFFNTVAKPQTVKNILGQAYGNKAAVTDELVQCILRPGLQPGAVRVFLDFISYSGGPLPEELLAATKVPVSIVWGEADPWEDVRLGRTLFANQPTVYEFVTLPGVGHCPMDESPELVNPLIEAFAAKHV
ncbi:hypothetical protein QJQ45_028719, partial [Haematococcus lacustris]